MNSIKTCIFIIIIFFSVGCKEDKYEAIEKNLTIFIVNDQHGQIDNFSKVKHIIDIEKQQGDVFVACGGDIFSGNPVVDNYPEKGYPMIEIMNKIGFDISVIGNHEFDYGLNILSDRIQQASFNWVCANVDMESTGIPQPFEYKTLSVGDLNITVLGLIETNGKPNAVIPSTHPLKVQGITFERPENVVSQFSGIKEQENSDLYIALTHLGHNGYNGILGDYQLAQQFPYFDLIIGAHSSYLIDTIVNNIPIFQAGSYLEYMGKIELTVKNKKVESFNYELINLNTYTGYDAEIQADIDQFNNDMAEVLNEVIGYSQINHERFQIGCFYTDALREKLEVDVTFQNYGGIRSGLDDGDITVREIYEIDPFNNGTVVFNMTVSEIKSFLMGTQSWFCFSGIQIEQIDNNIQIYDLNGNIIPDNSVLSVGINDYIPAVYDSYFPATGNIQAFTTADAIISYLKTINNEVNYPDCNRYFRYQ
ncbi:MAG: hypothetical protein C0599_11375 [Salinivirgaceae bacterium]|nr:MAG: hypothetical protein C0599_11375 [Salinivirgaceae bacterium]